jgi:hypothetical protein
LFAAAGFGQCDWCVTGFFNVEFLPNGLTGVLVEGDDSAAGTADHQVDLVGVDERVRREAPDLGLRAELLFEINVEDLLAGRCIDAREVAHRAERIDLVA